MIKILKIQNLRSLSHLKKKKNNDIYLYYALGIFEQFSYALDVNMTTDRFFFFFNFNYDQKTLIKKNHNKIERQHRSCSYDKNIKKYILLIYFFFKPKSRLR